MKERGSRLDMGAAGSVTLGRLHRKLHVRCTNRGVYYVLRCVVTHEEASYSLHSYAT